MAGHSHAKNVMHRKEAQNRKKAKIFTKFSRAISVAIKQGGSNDPEINSKLKFALKLANSAGVTKDIIKRAIEKGSNEKDLDEVLYEGYAPGGIAILVEALTDNKTKIAAEIRSVFSKHGGAMSEPNSVAFMFNRLAKIVVDTENFEKFFEIAIELNAVDVNENHAFFTPENLHKTQEILEEKGWQVIDAEICYIPQTLIEASNDEQYETFEKMINTLEENESVQNCWHNFKN